MWNLSIVVPTFNESGNIKELYERLADALTGISFELIFVDDSEDNTPKVIEKLKEEHSNVVLLHRESEKGLATAVLKGFSLAQGRYIAVMDADLQHPPEILRSMYAAVENGADFCIPSRFIPGGNDGGLNAWRKFVSSTARRIGKFMLKSLKNISDPTSGLFMFKREAIENADLQPIGWKIMVEVLAMADYNTVYEIPYTFRQRTAGESKLDSKVTVEYIKQLFGLRKREKKDRNVKVVRLSNAKTEKYVRELDKCLKK